jgi:hypothetical protein
MENEPLPEDLRRFVLRSVPSIPFVEALLIFRDLAAKALAIEALAKRLYVSERDAAQIVEQLRAAQVIQPAAEGTGHRYAPDPGLVDVLELLARYYRSHLVEVTALIHSRTGRMAQHFADAFKIRKD